MKRYVVYKGHNFDPCWCILDRLSGQPLEQDGKRITQCFHRKRDAKKMCRYLNEVWA